VTHRERPEGRGARVRFVGSDLELELVRVAVLEVADLLDGLARMIPEDEVFLEALGGVFEQGSSSFGLIPA